MNQKQLFWLVGIAVVLGLAFSFSSNDLATVGSGARVEVFRDVEGESIAKVKLQSDAKSLELVNTPTGWAVPDRGNYPADEGKIRSLLLQVLSLTVNQKITDSADKYKTLGVDDEALTRGNGKIAFSDSEGKELGALLIGESRRPSRRDEANQSGSTGQYVRRAGELGVFVIPDSISFATIPEGWIQTDLFSIPSSSVRHVRQYVVNGTTEQLEIDLLGTPEGVTPRSFGYQGAVNDNQTVEPSVVSQISSGLENARIVDVVSAGEVAAKLKDLQFDVRTVYELNSGLVYSVDSAKVGEDRYAKISVRFDPELAKAIQAEVDAFNQKLKTQEEEAKKNTEVAKEGSADPSASEKPPIKSELKLTLSSAEDATKLQQKFSPWVYKFAQYQGDKFRQSKATLVKEKSAAAKS